MNVSSAAQTCLQAFARAGAVSCAALYRIDERWNAVDFELLGLAPAMHRSYLDIYQRFDPLRPDRCRDLGRNLLTLGQAQSFQPPAVQRTYDQFLLQHRIRDVVEIIAGRDGRSVLGLSLLRIGEEEPFTVAELECLASLRALMQLALPSLCPTQQASLDNLTPREQELVRLLREGACNKRLAQALGVSLATIKTHLNNLYRKLGVHNRTELVAALFLPAEAGR